MSVRDRIAGFGGKSITNSSCGGGGGGGGGANKPAWASRRPVPAQKVPSSGAGVHGGAGRADPVRKLSVPDIFSNATKPADVPQPALVGQSSVPDKRFGSGASGSAPAAAGAFVNGGLSAARPVAGARGFGATSQPKPVDSSSRSKPSKQGAASTTATRDILGLGSGSTLYSRPVAGKDTAAQGGEGGAGTSTGAKETESMRPRNAGKKQTGPRKLLVAGRGKEPISAEKQRAALGLDKDKDTGDDDAGKDGRNVAGKEGGATGTGHNSQHAGAGGVSVEVRPGGGSGGQVASANSYATKRPAPATRTAAGDVGRVSGGIAPTVALRSSGHNLW